MSNSNNTTSIEELENNFFEKKCQLIEKAGDNQLVIVNFADIEDLISEAYSQGVTDGRKQAFSEANSATEAVDLANIKQKSFNSKRFMKLANEVNDILEKGMK